MITTHQLLAWINLMILGRKHPWIILTGTCCHHRWLVSDTTFAFIRSSKILPLESGWFLLFKIIWSWHLCHTWLIFIYQMLNFTSKLFADSKLLAVSKPLVDNNLFPVGKHLVNTKCLVSIKIVNIWHNWHICHIWQLTKNWNVSRISWVS